MPIKLIIYDNGCLNKGESLGMTGGGIVYGLYCCCCWDGILNFLMKSILLLRILAILVVSILYRWIWGVSRWVVRILVWLLVVWLLLLIIVGLRWILRWVLLCCIWWVTAWLLCVNAGIIKLRIVMRGISWWIYWCLCGFLCTILRRIWSHNLIFKQTNSKIFIF